MEDAKLRELVENELENLQLGVRIAKLRAAGNLSQTKLAAKAEMSAPKISAMENEPRNLTIGTLIRVAHYGNGPSRLPSFLRASREEKSKPAAFANTSGAQATRFKPKAAVPGKPIISKRPPVLLPSR